MAFALTPEQQAALDNLIQARRMAIPTKNKIQSASAQVQQLENRMTPLAFTFSRIGPLIGEQQSYLERLETYLKDPASMAEANPYLDRNWVDRNRLEIKAICCLIRKNPRIAKIVQENLAAGNPALSEEEFGNISARARAANSKSGGEAIPTLPSRPRTQGSSKGFSGGVISGLPTPSSSESGSDTKSAPAGTPPPTQPSATAPPSTARPSTSDAPDTPAPAPTSP